MGEFLGAVPSPEPDDGFEEIIDREWETKIDWDVARAVDYKGAGDARLALQAGAEGPDAVRALFKRVAEERKRDELILSKLIPRINRRRNNGQ